MEALYFLVKNNVWCEKYSFHSILESSGLGVTSFRTSDKIPAEIKYFRFRFLLYDSDSDSTILSTAFFFVYLMFGNLFGRIPIFYWQDIKY